MSLEHLVVLKKIGKYLKNKNMHTLGKEPVEKLSVAKAEII
jgi:hypothetical protein